MKKTTTKSHLPTSLCGDVHTYSSLRGKITLIFPCLVTNGTFEISCIEGSLLLKSEQYGSLQEAEIRIGALLRSSIAKIDFQENGQLIFTYRLKFTYDGNSLKSLPGSVSFLTEPFSLQ